MGIWQIFALSSVLNAPIRSVYPEKGNPNVRQDLNRLILPRTDMKYDVIYILWTNTRDDITESNWSPNHFVPLLPFTHECRNDVNNNENNLKENVNNNKNTDFNVKNNGENIDSKDDSKNTYYSDLGDKSEKNGDVDKNSSDKRKKSDVKSEENGEKSEKKTALVQKMKIKVTTAINILCLTYMSV
ncbi:hypothetical protein DPMN_025682 [Dreissena polymorpha]|uniref:Uncharacterized protein n=1 Tax=Dreissena polymorpha TaxID=45954 RepID=A0A9D4RCS0_DREPO|nr:hypothetical protein DPMN_025682 [Dreissena polymorpha]